MKRKNKQVPVGHRSLRIIQFYFPKVTRVVDADHSVVVEVTYNDVKKANVKDHKTCALAIACRRQFKADGVIIGLTKSYIIKGRSAERYSNAATVSREITSFDRKAGFDVGYYHLTPPSPSNRLGKAHRSGSPKTNKIPGKPRLMHFTGGVRTVIGRAPSIS